MSLIPVHGTHSSFKEIVTKGKANVFVCIAVLCWRDFFSLSSFLHPFFLSVYVWGVGVFRVHINMLVHEHWGHRPASDVVSQSCLLCFLRQCFFLLYTELTSSVEDSRPPKSWDLSVSASSALGIQVHFTRLVLFVWVPRLSFKPSW